MKRMILVSMVAVSSLSVISPCHASAPSNTAASPKEIPHYFFTTPQQLDELLVKNIQATHRDISIKHLQVHSRQYDLAGECDHVFFTFKSNDKLFLGIGELRESRVQSGKLVARTLIQSVDPRRPVEIDYAFSGCLPSLAGKVNDPSITRIDMVEGNRRTTPINVRDGFFFRVLDHGINVQEFQRVRFNAKDCHDRLVTSISGAELYPSTSYCTLVTGHFCRTSVVLLPKPHQACA